MVVARSSYVKSGQRVISVHPRDTEWWAYLAVCNPSSSVPASRSDNAMIETFNARMQAECLNESWFRSLDDAREKVEGWRHRHNI